jgi:hypothetical protein
MVSSLTDQQLEAVDDLELGACGTSKWARGEIAWAANCGLLVICIGIFTNVLLFFEFVLVPLTLAYFLTFLYAPVMDLFEHRPVECGCVHIYLCRYRAQFDRCCTEARSHRQALRQHC